MRVVWTAQAFNADDEPIATPNLTLAITCPEGGDPAAVRQQFTMLCQCAQTHDEFIADLLGLFAG